MLGIIGAMPEEISLVLENMDNVEEKQLGQVKYYLGKIHGKDTALCQSGIGKVNSAMVATTLIHVFKADAIVFTGVAGGVLKDIKLGDIVIGTDFLYHDFDATAIGYKLSQIPDKNEESVFHSDPDLSKKFELLADKLFGKDKVFRGRIVSGDDFVASADKIQKLRTLFDAYAVDMESAPVAHVCNKNNIPCCIIRSISDNADDEAGETYSGFFEEAAKNSAKLVIEYCKEN